MVATQPHTMVASQPHPHSIVAFKPHPLSTSCTTTYTLAQPQVQYMNSELPACCASRNSLPTQPILTYGARTCLLYIYTLPNASAIYTLVTCLPIYILCQILLQCIH